MRYVIVLLAIWPLMGCIAGSLNAATQPRLPSPKPPISCAEPDTVAIDPAITPGAVPGASAEAASQLAGRRTALMALRDGLYQACQAYANGAIDAAAYATIQARYQALLTTLSLDPNQPVAR